MVRASIGLGGGLSVEPFYLLEYRRNELEPSGTYFSTNDYASPGGTRLFLGSGALPDNGLLGAIPRGADINPPNSGQYGIAAHLLPTGHSEIEYGLYYARYHSRAPVISTRTPSAPINTDLTGPLTLAFIQGGVPAAAAGPQAVAIFAIIVKSQVAPQTLTPVEIATLQSPSIQAAIGGARRIALLQAAATARYVVEYPKD